MDCECSILLSVLGLNSRNNLSSLTSTKTSLVYVTFQHFMRSHYFLIKVSMFFMQHKCQIVEFNIDSNLTFPCCFVLPWQNRTNNWLSYINCSHYCWALLTKMWCYSMPHLSEPRNVNTTTERDYNRRSHSINTGLALFSHMHTISHTLDELFWGQCGVRADYLGMRIELGWVQ